eukprot:196332-Hanusia_phi.AAC.3
MARMSSDEVLSWLRHAGADERTMKKQMHAKYTGQQLVEEVSEAAEEKRLRRVRESWGRELLREE